MKYRNVSCHKVHSSGFVNPEPVPYNSNHRHYCDLYNKPAMISKCIDRNCVDMFSWTAGPWKEVGFLLLRLLSFHLLLLVLWFVETDIKIII